MRRERGGCRYVLLEACRGPGNATAAFLGLRHRLRRLRVRGVLRTFFVRPDGPPPAPAAGCCPGGRRADRGSAATAPGLARPGVPLDRPGRGRPGGVADPGRAVSRSRWRSACTPWLRSCAGPRRSPRPCSPPRLSSPRPARPAGSAAGCPPSTRSPRPRPSSCWVCTPGPGGPTSPSCMTGPTGWNASATSRSRWRLRAERTRIAREMHDVVAHHLTVMVALSDGAVGRRPRRPRRTVLPT